MMGYAELLAACQHRLEAARREGWSLVAACGPQCDLHEVHQRHLAPVWQSGRVVWSCLVKANSRAYEPGEESVLGYLIFCPSGDFAKYPERLHLLARKLRELSDATAPDPLMARLAEIAADDFAHVSNEPLPLVWTGGYEVYYTRTILVRAAFPRRQSEGRLLPLIIWPEGSPDCFPLPAWIWPDELASRYAQSEIEWNVSNRSFPPRVAPAAPRHYPRDPDYQWESLRPTAGEPPRLSRFAVERIYRKYQREGWSPADRVVCLVVDEDDGRPDPRDVNFKAGWRPGLGSHVVQDGLTIVWHPRDDDRFLGRIVHLEENWMTGGFFRFVDPPPAETPTIYLHLPGVVSPQERGDRYEDPLMDFLEEHDLGELVDAGTTWSGDDGPTENNCESYIGVETTDPERAFELLAPFLQRLGLPAGSRLTCGNRTVPLTE